MAHPLEGVEVPSRGPANARWGLVGEGPGESEAQRGEPFVGRAGKEQDMYLARHGLHGRQFFRANVSRIFHEGNPDPTPDEIARYSPLLERELAERKLTHILAIGRFSARWFLGEDTDIETVNGIPYRSERAPGAVIIPIVHPAAGFYDDDNRVLIHHGYTRAAGILRGKISAEPPLDRFAGYEDYNDVSGTRLAEVIAEYRNRRGRYTTLTIPVAIDTEGTPAAPWSIQVSLEPGTGYTLRCIRNDFTVGIDALMRLARHPSAVVVMHNAMYDLEMCRMMGADFYDLPLFDTRYAAYILRTEPQGLKSLCRRWCGMVQPDYVDMVNPLSLEQQLEYLGRVLEIQWPKPEAQAEYDNGGEWELKTPQPIERRAEAILVDYYSGKLDKDGERTDPHKRWRKVNEQLRVMVEAKLGPMPVATIADVPLDIAIRYASRDPDATLRLYYELHKVLHSKGLLNLQQAGCDVLPIFEEMQSNGLIGDRRYFERKSEEMFMRMDTLVHKIRDSYYGGQPFNPASPDKVAALMRRRDLTGAKKSKKTGKVSTAKKSIEHLRYEDQAMADVIDWRELQKMKDSFYDLLIEHMGDVEIGPVRTSLNPYKTATRRLASKGVPLLAIPVRNDLGVEVRDGFVAGKGYVYGSWDLSQIEMRWMAHLSKDEKLCKFMWEGKDAHSEVAGRIFHLNLPDTEDLKARYAPVDEKKHRYPAKRAAFGIITNITGMGLLDQLRMFGCDGWDVESCDNLIVDWLGFYTGVRQFLADCRIEVRDKGEVRDFFGMPRYLPGVWSDDPRVRAEAERAASSHKISGGAQGLLQNAMRYLKSHVRALQLGGVDIRWSLQIHDELILRVPEDWIVEIDALVKEALTEHLGVKLIVPVKCSGNWSDSWGKLK